jgi:hypothetical protein
MMTCKRSNGSERAAFANKEQALAFAADPVNVAYKGDIPNFCERCEHWHLSRPEWLALTPADAQFLEDCGIAAPRRLESRCVGCGCAMRAGIEFLILPNGDICCAGSCGRIRLYREEIGGTE